MRCDWTLISAIEWAEGLSDRDLRWHLVLMADDADFHHGFQRQAIIHETLKRMDRNV